MADDKIESVTATFGDERRTNAANNQGNESGTPFGVSNTLVDGDQEYRSEYHDDQMESSGDESEDSYEPTSHHPLGIEEMNPTYDASESTEQKEPELDPDISHVKGFQNTGDMSEIVELAVIGQLPEWLVGEHYTIGPGTYDIRYSRKIEIDGYLQSATCTFTFGHWFDALPLVNRIDFNGPRNTITYRNRLTSKRMIEKVRDHHGYAPCHPAGLFKTDSNQTMLIKFIKSAPKASKPDGEPCGARILTDIPGIEGRLFAQNLANHIQELDPFDLKPKRVLCWDEVNPAFKGYSSCPNGQYDRQTGEYINFTMEIGYRTTRYHFFSISDSNPKGKLITTLNAPTGYVHSFSLTPNYIVFVIFPLLANTAAVKFAWNESIMDSFSFYPSEPTLFYVISRQDGKHMVTYRSDPCFAFHHVNAFEDERNIIVDILCYKDATVAHQLTTQYLRNPSQMQPRQLDESMFRRYILANVEREHENFLASSTILPTVTGITAGISSLWSYARGTNTTVDVESNGNASANSGWYANYPMATYTKQLLPSLELPQINPEYKMCDYQFVYALGFSAQAAYGEGMIWDTIVKADVKSGNILEKWHEEGCFPGEPIFVPNAKTKENVEDDGVLLSIVMDSARRTSFVLVLDAKSFKEVARASLGTLVPLSFGRGSFRPRV